MCTVLYGEERDHSPGGVCTNSLQFLDGEMKPSTGVLTTQSKAFSPNAGRFLGLSLDKILSMGLVYFCILFFTPCLDNLVCTGLDAKFKPYLL